MRNNVLITGSKGLIGTRLRQMLSLQGRPFLEMDINGSGEDYGDVVNLEDLRPRVADVDGIIHLAAVSRVVWGELDPKKCWITNVTGTGNVIQAAIETKRKPWVLFVSSREVYGDAGSVPVTEDAPYAPASVYGNSKMEAEKMVVAAQAQGLAGGIVRLSNVYGASKDHSDRVLPAFVSAALADAPLKVEGADNCYDFTHLDDTVDGILRYITALDSGKRLQPIHLLTGVSTSLASLAEMVVSTLGSASEIRYCAPRDYGSGKFSGSNENAKRILGWQPKINLKKGIVMLAKEIEKGPHAVGQGVSPCQS